jgi:LacI family transcriptional regulator
MESKRITLKDISQVIGITPAAVGRALKDSPDISKDMKKRVREVADELGYSTNYLASALRTSRTNTICILVPDNSNPYNARLIKGIEDTARQNNFTVIMMNTEEDSATEKQAIQTASSLRATGILAVPVDLKNYENINVPFVLMARFFYDDVFNNYNYVVNDDRLIIELGVNHLLDRFERKIYFINGPSNFIPAINRHKAFKKKLESEGRQYSDDLVIFGENTSEGGYNSFKKIIPHMQMPASIICCSDYIAIGVLKAVMEYGCRVPDDISIVGCDDIEMLNYLSIPLTSVRQARYMIGVRATEHFLNIVNGNSDFYEILHSVLRPELVVRASTTPK